MKLSSALIMLVSGLISIALVEILVRQFVTVRNVGPSFTVYDPIYGRVLKKNFSARRYTPEFTMNITTNTKGFRGPLPGHNPIIFLGDSFTFGYGVNDGEEFPQLVGKHLDLPVLNRGIGNAGQAHWIKFLEREAQQYQPRLVVLQVLSNDFYDNFRERLFEFNGSELVELPVTGSTLKNTLQWAIEAVPGLAYSHLISLGREIRWGRTGRASITEAIPDQTLTIEMIRRSIKICRENGWPVLLVAPGIQMEPLENLKKLAVEILVLPGKAENPELFYEIDGHWNSDGHAMAAEQIIQILMTNNHYDSVVREKKN